MNPNAATPASSFPPLPLSGDQSIGETREVSEERTLYSESERPNEPQNLTDRDSQATVEGQARQGRIHLQLLFTQATYCMTRGSQAIRKSLSHLDSKLCCTFQSTDLSNITQTKSESKLHAGWTASTLRGNGQFPRLTRSGEPVCVQRPSRGHPQ